MGGRDGCVCVYRWESWVVVMVVSVCTGGKSWVVVMVVSVCTGGNRGWS